MDQDLFFPPGGKKRPKLLRVQTLMRYSFFEDVLMRVLSSPTDQIIDFLMDKGLLVRLCRCNGCGTHMKRVTYKRNKDGCAFRCMTSSCIQYKKYVSIRKNSFFDAFNISLAQCLRIMWKWMNGSTQSEILMEVNISKNAVKHFVNELRIKCVEHFARNPMQLGGEGVVCQIDESLFRHKQKYHVGRVPERELWVFGIADTRYTPAKIHLSLVVNRSAATLLPIISTVCLPGTIIHSDQWAAYRNIASSLNFIHQTVNHTTNFVDPVSGAHTQSIESYWNKIKLRIKKSKGCFGEHLNLFLSECMWKDSVCNCNFESFYNLLQARIN